LPCLAERIFIGNALHWQSPRRFSFVRTGLEYVPKPSRQELVERLLSFCDRLIVGVYNEERAASPTEDLVRSFGFEIAGRSERLHPRHPELAYRCLWIDSRA